MKIASFIRINAIVFISKNAYIMVAIYGRNFCLSAVDALSKDSNSFI